MTPLFLTGATGFVGRRVLAALPSSPFDEVWCLTRRPDAARALPEWRPQFEAVPGDLLDTPAWTSRVPAGCTVIHLAGATGKRTAREFQRENVQGTAGLLGAAAAASAAHFVYVSSIAASYRELTGYPYGASKRDAERLVRESGMPYTILRPTMVFGSGSPNQRGLERLALLPVPVMFGDGTVRVQPVHADDVAAIVLRAAGEGWIGETVEVGGAVTLTLNALFALMRTAHGRPPRRPVHLPLAPVRALLAAVEPLLLPLLPFTAGQLAAFRNPSCAQPSPRLRESLPALEDLEAMLTPRSGARA